MSINISRFGGQYEGKKGSESMGVEEECLYFHNKERVRERKERESLIQLTSTQHERSNVREVGQWAYNMQKVHQCLLEVTKNISIQMNSQTKSQRQRRKSKRKHKIK